MASVNNTIDDISFQKLVDDINEWCSNSKNYIYLIPGSQRMYQKDINNLNKNTIKMYEYVNFYTTLRVYPMIIVKIISNEEITKIQFFPTTDPAFNFEIKAKDNIGIIGRLFNNDISSKIDIYNVSEMYSYVRGYIMRTKSHYTNWSMGEYYFDMMPKLSLLQHILDKFNPHKEPTEIIIEI